MEEVFFPSMADADAEAHLDVYAHGTVHPGFVDMVGSIMFLLWMGMRIFTWDHSATYPLLELDWGQFLLAYLPHLERRGCVD